MVYVYLTLDNTYVTHSNTPIPYEVETIKELELSDFEPLQKKAGYTILSTWDNVTETFIQSYEAIEGYNESIIEPPPTMEELQYQILAESHYQTALLEMTTLLGGI